MMRTWWEHGGYLIRVREFQFKKDNWKLEPKHFLLDENRWETKITLHNTISIMSTVIGMLSIPVMLTMNKVYLIKSSM